MTWDKFAFTITDSATDAIAVNNMLTTGIRNSATGAFVVIRQDDPSDTKSKDAIVATRCDVLMIVCGDNQAQVSGAMGKVCTCRS